MEEITNSIATLVVESKKSQESQAQLSDLILTIKSFNRDAYSKLREAKRLVLQERNLYDEKILKLESLKFEAGYLENEICACQAYQSEYHNVDLVTMEEFSADMMGEVPEDEHQLTLLRLNDELNRRKALMERLKLAEISRDAEKDKLGKIRKEMETLRDHAKTIYKMAVSYKLATFVSNKVEEKRLAPLQKLLEEFNAYVGEKAGWKVELYQPAIEELEEGEEIDTSSSTRHSSDVSEQKIKRYFDHAYLEIVPPLDVFDGIMALYHAKPSDASSPILIIVVNCDATLSNEYLMNLPLDATLLLLANSVEDQPSNGVAFRWLQTLAGFDNDMAFAADPRKCISSFFKAIRQTPAPIKPVDLPHEGSQDNLSTEAIETGSNSDLMEVS